MIRVSVMYPTTAGASFDMDYYCNKHMPMVRDRCGEPLKNMTIDEGISGGMPNQPAAYVCVGTLTFDSIDAFQGSFGPHMAEIMGDIPNYTSIVPIVQISEAKL